MTFRWVRPKIFPRSHALRPVWERVWGTYLILIPKHIRVNFAKNKADVYHAWPRYCKHYFEMSGEKRYQLSK